jgi:PhnB protein
MKKIMIPEGYQMVMPYIIVKNSKAFMQFMKEVFDAVEKMTVAGDNDTIKHGEVMIGDSTIMFAEGNDDWKPMTAGLYIIVANADETYNKALQAGAKSVMPPADMEYGRSSGVEDAFGNTWWITSALS